MYLGGCRSYESCVLHFIWKSVGWYPLCLWLLENSFFWKMVLFGSNFSSVEVVLELMQIHLNVYHWDWDACLDIYLDVTHERFYLDSHIFEKCRIWNRVSWENLLQSSHFVQWGGEAIPFMSMRLFLRRQKSLEAPVSIENTRDHFFLFCRQVWRKSMLPCHAIAFGPWGTRGLLHLHASYCLKTIVLF